MRTSDLGLNLKGGMVFNRTGNAQPYGEAILNFANGTEALIFRAGLLFYSWRLRRRFRLERWSI